jgi:DNA-binding GntR family transcriptional regulator
MSYAISAIRKLPATRKEAVLQQLRHEIVNGRLTPGTVLKDAEVAARVGLSITPVREAIAQLAAEGLINIEPNRTRHVTHVTQKNALELIDVMAVLTHAGFRWGMRNLTPAHLVTLRGQYQALADHVRRGDVSAAAGLGMDFTSTIVLASGNRELQTHLDLVLARTQRVLALTPESSEIWTLWSEGYRETLELLEADDKTAALNRFQRMYADYRQCVQESLFEEGVPAYSASSAE